MEGNTNNSIGVKLTYEGQMRRFPFTGESYAVFYEQILALLGLEKSAEVVLKYTDEEGDQITISSDIELKSALVPGQLLRITVVPKTRAVEPTPFVPAQHLQAQHQLYQHPHAQHFQQHIPPVFPGAPNMFNPLVPVFAPAPVHAPFAPGGDFTSFQHGCGRGEKWDKKMEKMAQKRYKKMAKHQKDMPEGFLPPHMQPHPYPHLGHHQHRGGGHKERKGNRLVARFVSDVTMEDGTVVAPLTPFVKTWRIRNEGPAWPQGCGLLFISKKSGDLNSPQLTPVEGEVPTGTEVNISVNMVAPAKSGRYTGYWRLCTADGHKFGQRVWVSIVVGSPTATTNSSEEERESDKYEALVDVVLRNEVYRTLGIKRHWVCRLLYKCDGDVGKVQAILNKKVEKRINKQRG